MVHAITRSLYVRPYRLVLALALAFNLEAFADSDPRTILGASANAMGGDAPTSSDAHGTVHIVEGSTVRDGTIRVVTRGLFETNDIIDAGRHQEQAFGHGRARERDAGSLRQLNKERTASSFSVYFPLVLIRSILNDPDSAYEYIGSETAEGRACQHIRVWNTYLSQRGLAELTPVTIRDFWIDAATRLPVRLGFRQWEAQGATWAIPIVVVYSDFTAHGGKQYPHTVEKQFNGTPWVWAHFETVSLDASIPDSVITGE